MEKWENNEACIVLNNIPLIQKTMQCSYRSKWLHDNCMYTTVFLSNVDWNHTYGHLQSLNPDTDTHTHTPNDTQIIFWTGYIVQVCPFFLWDPFSKNLCYRIMWQNSGFIRAFLKDFWENFKIIFKRASPIKIFDVYLQELA